MSYHDFVCPSCGMAFTDIDIPIAIGAKAGAPSCADCQIQTDWIPKVGRMDALEPFQTFTAYDGQNNPVVIDSLHKLRTIERASEQQARNGEGQPIVWRAYSQDRSNRDVNTLGAYGGEAPSPEAKRKFGSSLQKSAGEPDVALGPGVTESSTGGLGDA